MVLLYTSMWVKSLEARGCIKRKKKEKNENNPICYYFDRYLFPTK